MPQTSDMGRHRHDSRQRLPDRAVPPAHWESGVKCGLVLLTCPSPAHQFANMCPARGRVLACVLIHSHDPVPSRDGLLPRLSSISSLVLSNSSLSTPQTAQAPPSLVWRGLQKPSAESVWLLFPCQVSSWAPVGCLRCHLLLTSTWLCSCKVLWLSTARTQRQSPNLPFDI